MSKKQEKGVGVNNRKTPTVREKGKTPTVKKKGKTPTVRGKGKIPISKKNINISAILKKKLATVPEFKKDAVIACFKDVYRIRQQKSNATLREIHKILVKEKLIDCSYAYFYSIWNRELKDRGLSDNGKK